MEADRITAIASVIGSLGSLIIAISVLLTVNKTSKQVEGVHTIVNQQRTDAQRYQIALLEVLKANKIDIPIDQSLPVTNQPDARKETP